MMLQPSKRAPLHNQRRTAILRYACLDGCLPDFAGGPVTLRLAAISISRGMDVIGQNATSTMHFCVLSLRPTNAAGHTALSKPGLWILSGVNTSSSRFATLAICRAQRLWLRPTLLAQGVASRRAGFSSTAEDLGYSIPTIKALIGHSQRERH